MIDQATRLRELMAVRYTPSRTVAVTSGKGGVGKTTLALNLGLALAQHQRRVVILDGDMGTANVDVMLGIYPRHSVFDVVTGNMFLKDIMVDGPCNLRIIPGGSGIAELADLDDRQRQDLVEKLWLAEREMEFLIVDTGAGIGRGVMSLLLAAEEVIVVLTPEPTALADAYALIKSLAKSRSHRLVNLVINRVGGAAEAREIFRRLEMVVSRFLSIELRLLGFVYDDALVGRAIVRQQPLLLSYPRSRAAEQLRLIALRLQGETACRQAQDGGFFLRLLQRLGWKPGEG